LDSVSSGLFQEEAGGFADFLEAEPVEMGGLFPEGEILFGDGAALEPAGEDAFDVVLAVEPENDVGAGFVVFDAAAQFVAGGFREASLPPLKATEGRPIFPMRVVIGFLTEHSK
jgi:hypothetical protein